MSFWCIPDYINHPFMRTIPTAILDKSGIHPVSGSAPVAAQQKWSENVAATAVIDHFPIAEEPFTAGYLPSIERG
jgi:hypothetical protein